MKMNGEPERIRGSVRDAVSSVSGNEEMIAGLEMLLGFRELKSGTPAEQDDPFIVVLIIPKIWRARLSMGKDALDFYRRIFQKGQELFIVGRMRRWSKEIGDRHNGEFEFANNYCKAQKIQPGIAGRR